MLLALIIEQTTLNEVICLPAISFGSIVNVDDDHVLIKTGLSLFSFFYLQ